MGAKGNGCCVSGSGEGLWLCCELVWFWWALVRKDSWGCARREAVCAFHGGAVLIFLFSLLFPWKGGWRALECMQVLLLEMTSVCEMWL